MVYQKTFMKEWKTYKIRDIATVNLSQYSLKEGWNEVTYLDTGSITENHIEDIQTFILPCDDFPSRARRKVQHNDILFSTVRPNQKHFGILKNPNDNLLVSTGFSVITVNPLVADANFVYYYITQQEIINYLQSVAEQSVSAYPSLKSSDIEDIDIELPSLYEQRRLALILKSIDDKIENNNRINHNLLNLAQELFNNSIAENACCSSGWRSASLLDIAEYLNGLAMQKYPAINGEFSLPVLKIKELGQQACDANSDRCTESIPEQFIVKDGDIIFSWSGTLLVDFWCGGKCGLNQHLFKVSSDMYPNWFVYFWTKHHLDRFIRIAKDKAVTMGHIKRGDLGKAVVVIPEDAVMEKLNGEIAPLISECIERRIENRKLQSLRNSLLPKLMSGELKINDLTC